MIFRHNILASLTILLYTCKAPQENETGALHAPDQTVESTQEVVPERDFSGSARLFAQEVLEENFREHSFDLSTGTDPMFLKVFCPDGLKSVRAYSNKTYPKRGEPNYYEHFTVFVATYTTQQDAKACFELLKSESLQEPPVAGGSQELSERVKLLTVGAKPGGMLVQNGLQVFSLVETCRGTPIGGSWLDYENKFLGYITEAGQQIEVLNSDCGKDRYQVEQRAADL